MNKVIIWGTGAIARQFISKQSYLLNCDIIGFVDNDNEKWGKEINGIPIFSPTNLLCINFEQIIICTKYYNEIMKQINYMGLNTYNCVCNYLEFENKIKKLLINKYQEQAVNNIELKKVIDFYEENELNIYGYYNGKKGIKYKVYRNEEFPYIFFEGKKMYYPKSYIFLQEGKEEYAVDVLYEQGENSPHLYIKKGKNIKPNLIFVDAGVCEGNFALRYVENAKKIYLIESDEQWIEVLKKTFEPYKEKVVFCSKLLSDNNGETSITLDTLVNEKIDILKMDIEGFEILALKGAKNILLKSDAYCAICSYHKQKDEKNITEILNSYGYNTSTSEGYMYFPYDKNLEFRKGIVYGTKNNNDN